MIIKKRNAFLVEDGSQAEEESRLKARELINVKTNHVSLVDVGANRKKFALVKRADGKSIKNETGKAPD